MPFFIARFPNHFDPDGAELLHHIPEGETRYTVPWALCKVRSGWYLLNGLYPVFKKGEMRATHYLAVTKVPDGFSVVLNPPDMINLFHMTTLENPPWMKGTCLCPVREIIGGATN